MNTQSVQHLISIFYQALVAPTVEFTIKKHLHLIFESLLQIYQTTEADQSKLQEFYDNLFQSIHNQLQTSDMEVTKGVLLISQATILNLRPINLLKKVFPGITNLMCKLAEHYISLLSNDLMVISAASPA